MIDGSGDFTEETAALQPALLTPLSLIPHLQRCGYRDALLAHPYDFGSGTVPVAAFADTPHDSRSACVAVIETGQNPEEDVIAIRPLGTPVVLACYNGSLQWWKQTTGTPVLHEKLDSAQLQRFFSEHQDDLGPKKVFEGKTLRRLPHRTQLSFVDAGLLPFVEREQGAQLSGLVERALRDIEETLARKIDRKSDIDNAIKATFWLLAAKALRDKGVKGFKTADLADVDDVFTRVGRHYGVPDDVPPPGRKWQAATLKAAQTIDSFPSLRNLSTESLAHVYENALVTPEIRKAYGTHSTPSALVDYMVWQLWPWIEALPVERRHVFEPACGHGAFLVGALRLLRQWSAIDDGKDRHNYLKEHLHGVEVDPFALEVARLSLTLADIPHGNTWKLKRADMFVGTTLEDGATKCGVLLANPPFEKFTRKERETYRKAKVTLTANSKACEMLWRTIPRLSRGASFGVVVPQGLLHSNEARDLRRTLLSDFELSEIDTFEDKFFERAQHETAVLLGRRKSRRRLSGTLWFRRIRNADMSGFRNRFAFSSEELVEISRFAKSQLDLRVPELAAVWRYSEAHTRLAEIATLGQGLFHKGAASLPRSSWTTHDPPRPRDVRGVADLSDDPTIYGFPKIVGINIASSVIDREVAGFPTNKPQVLLNYGRAGRDRWRLKAFLDEKGRALTNRFIAVRPASPEVTALYLWAILNSPVANAYAHCVLGAKRDNQVGTMRNVPAPRWSLACAANIEQAAMRYRQLAVSPGRLFNDAATPEGIKQALLDLDAAVLKAYDFPPRLERQLLDYFAGVERKGVGCPFTGYYPPGFSSYLPLHVFLSERFERAAAHRTADRFHPGESEHVRQTLAIAATAFDQD